MKYEYTTWIYNPLTYKGDIETSNNAVITKINQMADSGWEYLNSIATGASAWAILVFRRVKN